MTKAVYEVKPTSDEDEGGLKTFLWNPAKKTVCGRGGLSWLKIMVFFVIFYFCLGVYWIAMLYAFYQTLPLHSPKWTLDSSCIGSNPGLTFRPQYYHHIRFNPEMNDTWDHLASDLGKFLDDYDPEKQQGGLLCSFNRTMSQPHVCAVPLDQFGNNCTKANYFGYEAGSPCIALKLNRIFDWYPEPFADDSLPSLMPDYIKQAYDPKYIYISCKGENPADEENLGPVQYFPENGTIPNFYFPFQNQPGYTSPFVFVHFEKPETEVLIKIECKAWAANIKHHRANRLGSVRLTLHIE